MSAWYAPEKVEKILKEAESVEQLLEAGNMTNWRASKLQQSGHDPNYEVALLK